MGVRSLSLVLTNGRGRSIYILQRSPRILPSIATHTLFHYKYVTHSLPETPVLTKKTELSFRSLRAENPALRASDSFMDVLLLVLHQSHAHIRSCCQNDKEMV